MIKFEYFIQCLDPQQQFTASSLTGLRLGTTLRETSNKGGAGASGMPNSKILGLVLVGGALATLAGIAAVRETRMPPPVQAAAPSAAGMGESQDRPALSADEERFAHDLWKVHAGLRTEAVRMTFTGLSYKMGEIPKEAVRERIAPLTRTFSDASAAVRQIQTAQALEPTRSRYLEAVALYERASTEMIKVAQDGRDDHLLRAQQMSEQASTILLEIGDKLWPGEYKPN